MAIFRYFKSNKTPLPQEKLTSCQFSDFLAPTESPTTAPTGAPTQAPTNEREEEKMEEVEESDEPEEEIMEESDEPEEEETARTVRGTFVLECDAEDSVVRIDISAPNGSESNSDDVDCDEVLGSGSNGDDNGEQDVPIIGTESMSIKIFF